MDLKDENELKLQALLIIIILSISLLYLPTPTIGPTIGYENSNNQNQINHIEKQLEENQIEPNTKFALIADPHVSVDRNINNEAFIDALENIDSRDNLDFVLVLGDLVDWASEPNWKLYENIVENFEIPIFNVVGNHDYRETMYDILYPGIPCPFWEVDNSGLNYYQENLSPRSSPYYENFKENWKLESGPKIGDYKFKHKSLQMIMINSGYDSISKTDAWLRGSGLYDSQIEWLRENFEKRENIFISMHHTPIFEYENSKMEGLIQNLGKFQDFLEEKEVKAVLSGHIHLNLEQNFDNTQYIVTSDPPAYRILEFYPDGSMNTEVKNLHSVGEFKETRVTINQVWRGIQWTHIDTLDGIELLFLIAIILIGSTITGFIINSSKKEKT